MINLLVFLSFVGIFLVTGVSVFIIVKINKIVKRILLNTYIMEQKIIIGLDNVKKKLAPKPKKKRKFNKLKNLLLVADIALAEIYKRKYERLKDYYEFIKNTMA